MREWIVTAPLAFIVGVVVGLGLSSRYLIVRRRDHDENET